MSEKHHFVAVENVGLSQAMPVVYEAMHEILQVGTEHWRPNEHPLDLNSPAVIAVDTKANEVVGLLTYQSLDKLTVKITLAYVEASSRRLGVFTKLLALLKHELRIQGIRNLVLDVGFDNAEMTHVAAAFKLRPTVKTYKHSF